MYIEDVNDLCRKARAHFSTRGRCLAADSTQQQVQLMLYQSQIFYISMPQRPGMTSLSFGHEVSQGVRTSWFLGNNLAFVENAQQDVETAFDVLDHYARLRLPDKFLEAYDALTTEDLAP